MMIIRGIAGDGLLDLGRTQVATVSSLKDYALDHHIHITPDVSSSSSLSFGLIS